MTDEEEFAARARLSTASKRGQLSSAPATRLRRQSSDLRQKRGPRLIDSHALVSLPGLGLRG
jgi:hypothetical protein